jgi:hypothetical protein
MRTWQTFVTLTITALAVSSAAICQTDPAVDIEAKVKEKLDRMFAPDQYLLDVQMSTVPAANNDQILPGLGGISAADAPANIDPNWKGQSPTTLRGDALLIIDRAISSDRARVAEQIVKRIVEGEGLKSNLRVSMKQQDIRKVDDSKEKSQPNFFELLDKNKDLLVKALMVLWGGLVSLFTIYLVLKRILGVSPPATTAKDSRAEDSPTKPRSESEGGGESRAKKTAASKDELYSKDQALMTLINEIVDTAKQEPKKISKILTKLVADSEDNAHSASIFLKNCDIKTIEKICSLLHPSDLEKILKQKVEDFDPFSDENKKVLELMRSDLALQAAESLVREKPDPLDFMRTLSEEEISNVLEGESITTVALVSTQIPAHRLQKFYAGLPHEVLSKVLIEVAKIKSPTVDDFSNLRDSLGAKTAKLSVSLFSERAKIQTLAQLLSVAVKADTQINLAMHLRSEDRQIYNSVRQQLVLALDLDYLSPRVSTVLIQSIDADVLACALSPVSHPFEQLTAALPDTYATVFRDMMTRKFDDDQRLDAWMKVQAAMRDLTQNGLITQSELSAAIALCEQQLDAPKDQQQNTEQYRGVA